MKNRYCLSLILLLLVLNARLFALGKAEETEKKTQNDEWILCVTDFDVGSISEEKLNVANVITKKIVDRLSVIVYRTRISPEYAYYEGYAWSRARAAAAKALSAKQNERSLLAFRGDSEWKYRQNLLRIDADIEKLKLAFDEVEKESPLINSEPVFKLTAGNMSSSFPQAPNAGSEYRFCVNQKADAFLAGSIMDFHGRFYISIKLFTVYTQSYVYEDSVIFSADDLEASLDEITGRLIVALTGNKPAVITVKTQPEDALVLINRTFTGKGGTTSLEYPPGKFTITASAPDHESLTVETELSSGEFAEIDIKLKQIQYGNIEIQGPLSGASVYQGALYAGETPLTLRLPLNSLDYIELETLDKKKGSAVFQMPDVFNTTYSLSLNTAEPLEKGRVDKARRLYYWAWGGTWITGIAAWIAYHTYISSDTAIRYDYAERETYDHKFADNNITMYYVSMGTIIAVGAAVLYEIFNIGKYVYTADKGSTSIAKPVRSQN